MDGILFDYGGTLDSDGTTWIDRFFRITQDLGMGFPRPSFDRAFYDSDDNLPARFALKGLSLEQTLTLQVNGVVTALAPDVLRHRLLLTYESEADGVTPDELIKALLAATPRP